MSPSIATLARLISNEVVLAMGLPEEGWLQTWLHGLLAHATRRFAALFAEVDRIVGEQGAPAGARWLLRSMGYGCEARGAEAIPNDGPLIIASNHPGAVDSLVLLALAQRLDLKILAGARPFLQSLPHISQHLIFAPQRNIQARMQSVRDSIRHLREGGSLLLFARGTIDPDPAFMPDALEELSAWSRSLEIFMRSVPELQVVVSIVSHVIHPAYMHHPITWLRSQRRDRQRLAMMMQIIQQMLGRKLALAPRVSFGGLVRAGQIGSGNALEVLNLNARQLMRSHLSWQG